jgi:cytochrome c5
MKKLLLITGAAMMVVLVVSFVSMPSHAINDRASSSPSVASAIPDSVTKILEKCCYACHSEPGKGMALSKLNFDKWADYKPEKQADKAKDICKEVSKGAMPPKSFRHNNPDKVPAEAEVKIICNWAASFVKK